MTALSPPPQTYFEDNPRDLQLLRHDLPLHPAVVKPHLGHVPDYLGEWAGWVATQWVLGTVRWAAGTSEPGGRVCTDTGRPARRMPPPRVALCGDRWHMGHGESPSVSCRSQVICQQRGAWPGAAVLALRARAGAGGGRGSCRRRERRSRQVRADVWGEATGLECVCGGAPHVGDRRSSSCSAASVVTSSTVCT